MQRWSLVSLIALAVGAMFFGSQSTVSADRATPQSAATGTKTAVFAGGCFWCMEKPFDLLDGVSATISGYTGGTVANPSYEQVSAGGTGHTEAVSITYDPAKVSYQQLLEIFWRNIDPLDSGGQFCDRGSQYRSAIFVADASERRAAEASKAALEKRLGKPIATEITTASKFYAAEDYHQNYYQKNPLRYRYYRGGCGRDSRLEAVWGDEAGGAKVAVQRKEHG
ncbi:MAG TPA: peptide-methionine (S)-S-oxide reductase MsrA [Steroidobacteraceae bacterium]|nr:peptide-methionine (S)-S-oxide reductase MsrA [Steroidobacteraceae bacterium]HRX89955.1 peptide-methionine (S)-S-oxide reductase MsrA [Steroidobacteraceae bacterium]